MDDRDLEAAPHPWQRVPAPLRWPAAMLAVAALIAGMVVIALQAVPDRRPVVLSVYCASSAVWVTTLAPLIESQASGDDSTVASRVTASRIRSAYERRCPSSG